MPYLVVENGEHRGDKIEILTGGKVVFGRDQRADITVDDHICSRRHFEVEESQGKFVLRDLGSSNGTYLNDVRVLDSELTHGDCLRAGETQLTFLDEGTGGGRGLVGKTVGGYRILDRIGRGGMGTVYKALQVSLNRVVALKILSHKVSQDPVFVAKFTKEAQAAGRLNHPNIVQVYDVASDRDLHFFSMEYIENGSVQDLLNREGKLDIDLALAITLDAARGLEYAEKRNLVHQDIKPDNLMINADGLVKIADLGLARDAGESAKGNGVDDEGIFGTPHFISPEQAQGHPVDTRSDIYSLGATFYRLLAGTTPFDGSTIREIIVHQIQDDPPPLREHTKSCPAPVAQLIERMMKKDPEERVPTAAALVEELERLNQALEGSGRKPLLIAGTLALVAVAVGAFVLFGNRDPKPTPPVPPKDTGPPIVGPISPQPVDTGLQERRAKAIGEYTTVRLDDGNLVGNKRTLESLGALRTSYQKLIDTYPEDDAAIEKVRSDVREQLTRLDQEIAGIEAEVAAAEGVAREKAAQALARANAGRNAADEAVALDQFSRAIAALREAQAAPEVAASSEGARLAERLRHVQATAATRASALLASANDSVAEGKQVEAASLLASAAEQFITDAGGELEFAPIKEQAEALVTRASAIRLALKDKIAADRVHDQTKGFSARREALLALRKNVDLVRAKALLDAALGELRTDSWRTILERDVADLAAAQETLSEFRRIAEKAGKGALEVRLPNKEGDRLLPWKLQTVDAQGFTVEKGPFTKRHEFTDFSPKELFDFLLERHLPTTPEARANAARLLLLGGWPGEALALLQDEEGHPTGDESLWKRVLHEVAALESLKQIRRLEAEAATNARAYLELVPLIDAFLTRHRGTVAFTEASDGSTPVVIPDRAP